MTAALHILLADTEDQRIRPLRAAFTAAGWSCTVVQDATQALVAARKAQPDAVVLAAQLPAGGSQIILKRLRASVETAATPVILVGNGAADTLASLQGMGAQAQLPEGADAEAVSAAIRRHLGLAAPVLAPPEVVQSPLRMAALRASGLLDSPPEAAFDRVTALAARLLNAPSALLSLIDADRQFFKSQVGVPEPWASARETPLTHSFCQWVVCGREPVVVNDARQHPVLRYNPAVSDMQVIAYIGVPVQGSQGEVLGSFCAVEAQPRQWSAEDQAVLQDLSRLVESAVAHAELLKSPPRHAGDFDRYVEAAHGAISGALGILRRGGTQLTPADRSTLYDLIAEYSQQLVQLNRLIQVHQIVR